MEDVMQRMIWIPDDLVEGIKESAVREGKSVSQYLIDCHRGRTVITVKDVKLERPDIEVIKQAVRDKEKTKYSDEYRKKNPMERCSVCQKALSMNCSH